MRTLKPKPNLSYPLFPRQGEAPFINPTCQLKEGDIKNSGCVLVLWTVSERYSAANIFVIFWFYNSYALKMTVSIFLCPCVALDPHPIAMHWAVHLSPPIFFNSSCLKHFAHADYFMHSCTVSFNSRITFSCKVTLPSSSARIARAV